MKDDLVRRKDVLALTHELNFKNIPGLEHYKHRCIDPDAVREMEGVDGTCVGQRVEETNKVSTELENTLANCINDTTNLEAAIAMILTAQCSVNTEIAKSLAQLTDDIHFIKEAMAKEQEEAEKLSTLTCSDCKYSDVIDHVNTGFLTRFNVEFCRCLEKEVDFRFTPICDRFKQKEEEAES